MYSPVYVSSTLNLSLYRYRSCSKSETSLKVEPPYHDIPGFRSNLDLCTERLALLATASLRHSLPSELKVESADATVTRILRHRRL